jgi:hypothetical protein
VRVSVRHGEYDRIMRMAWLLAASSLFASGVTPFRLLEQSQVMSDSHITTTTGRQHCRLCHVMLQVDCCCVGCTDACVAYRVYVH